MSRWPLLFLFLASIVETSKAQRAKPLGQMLRLQHYNLLKYTMSTNYLLWNVNLPFGAFTKITDSVIWTILNRATITTKKDLLAWIWQWLGEGGGAVAARENLHQRLSVVMCRYVFKNWQHFSREGGGRFKINDGAHTSVARWKEMDACAACIKHSLQSFLWRYNSHTLVQSKVKLAAS